MAITWLKNPRTRTWFSWIGVVLLSAVFATSRLWGIQTSLLYFIDAGRDSNVLLTWRETGIPPLLGPQTSVLPINQSAWYFYLLMPFFLLTNGSPFAAIYAGVGIYLVVFWWLMWLYRRQPSWQVLVGVLWVLVASHPQFVLQNRFIWNPSFVGPALLIAGVCWEQARRSPQWRWLMGLGGALAAAVGFSYSAAPVLVVSAVLSVLWLKRQVWKLWLTLGLGLVLVMAPLGVFELRHHFPLTRMLMTQKAMPQTETTWQLKWQAITRYSVEPVLGEVAQPVWLVVMALMLLAWHAHWWQKDAQRGSVYRQLLMVYGGVMLILFLMPVSILSHYIFGFLTVWLALIALLPWRLQFVIVVILLCNWWWPTRIQTYFIPARRTVTQMQTCFQRVCAEWATRPLYTSVQAGFHPFHAAQEHRYLLRQAGCDVPEIDVSPTAARYMAVVVDDSQYTHGQTAYNELTQFGQSRVVQTYTCQANFQVVMLER